MLNQPPQAGRADWACLLVAKAVHRAASFVLDMENAAFAASQVPFSLLCNAFRR